MTQEVDCNRQLAWNVGHVRRLPSGQHVSAQGDLTLTEGTGYYSHLSGHISSSDCPITDSRSWLVFAVLSLGTSLHWTTHAVPEHSWLEAARNLLSLRKAQFSAKEGPLHTYFCKVLTYWEIILSSVDRGTIAAKVDRRRGQYSARFHQALHVQDNNGDSLCTYTLPYDAGQGFIRTQPNSWCGVSNEVIDLF